MTLCGHFLALAIVRKWYYPQHIVASTLLKPRFWGTFFLIPPTACTNRISTRPKPRFWSTHVQDPWNILTNQIFESIVSLLWCRSATTVLQILTFSIVSSSSGWRRVVVWVLICAHISDRFWHSAMWALSVGVDLWSYGCRFVTTVPLNRTSGVSLCLHDFTSWLHFTS